MDLDALFIEHTKLKKAYDDVVAEIAEIKSRLAPIHALYVEHVEGQKRYEEMELDPTPEPAVDDPAPVGKDTSASDAADAREVASSPSPSAREAPPTPESDPPGPKTPANDQGDPPAAAASTNDDPGPVGAGVDVSAEAQDQTPKP